MAGVSRAGHGGSSLINSQGRGSHGLTRIRQFSSVLAWSARIRVIRVIRVPDCSHNNRARLSESRMTSRLLPLLVFAATAAAEPAPFVWIEAESPSEGTPKVTPAGAAHLDWLSGGKWLFVNIEPKDQAAQLPKGEAYFK